MSDLTIEILKGIRSELVGLRQDVNGVKGELTELRVEMRSELSALRVELRTGLSEVRVELGEVREQLHELAEFTQTGFQALIGQGDHRFLDHEGRLRRLEAHAGFEPPPR